MKAFIDQIIRKLNLKSALFNVKNLTHLIYPEACLICENELTQNQTKICSFCIENFPFTKFENYKETTRLEELFYGRSKIENGYALLYFEKNKATQKILHQIKYKDQPELGMYFGEIIAQKLNQSEWFKTIDAILPVPIHHLKAFKRGYNQSEKIAEGIANVSGLKIENKALTKILNTKSQTKNNKQTRWENIQNSFELNSLKNNIHIAIVDDVITTGSTLETIINEIHKKYPDIRISIISLAITK